MLFFAHLGPEIPVKFTTTGDIDADINQEVKSVGINNTCVSLTVDVRVQIEVIIPFATNMEVVSTSVPVGMMLVPGKVPQFCSTGQNNVVPAIMPKK